MGKTRGSWLSLLVASGVLVLAGLFDVSPGSASLGGLEGPHCLLGATLGERSCPGCGLTRGTALAVQGQWAACFATHPAGFVVALLCGAAVLVHLHILVGRRRRRGHAALLRLGRGVFVVGLAAGWLVRLV